MKVSVDTQTGQIAVERNGREVLRQTAPTAFSKNGVTVEFAQQPKDYFYGGGCQNGRFSHRGEIIKIVNDNNWGTAEWPARIRSIGVPADTA